MKRSLAGLLAALSGLVMVSVTHAEWTTLTPMPGFGRHHPVTFTLGDFGYVATGSVTGDNATDDFFRYDPVSDTWTVLPAFPGVDRSYAYGGTYDGKGYLGFGVGGGGGHRNDLWSYDPVSETWTQLASCPGAGRAHPAFVITDNGKIFVGAGNTPGQNLRDWWEYDIATDTWVQRPNIPGPPRHHPYYFNIGNDAYVCFGHGASIYDDVYRWSQDTVSWTIMNVFPGEGRVAGTQFSYNGKGYALSGEGEDHVQLDEGECWEYDPNLDSWTRLESHPGSGRWAPGSFLIGDTVYFLGGLSTARLEKDMMKFTLASPTDVVVPISRTDEALRLYPNPIRGFALHVFDPEATLLADEARLFDATGRQIAKLSGTSTLSIPRHVAAGKYFVRLRTRDGEQVTKGVTVLR